MMIDVNERFSLSYKIGEPDLQVFMRKYDHGYMEKSDSKSREGCASTIIPSMHCFLISDDNTVAIHDEATFKTRNMIEVPLDISDTREPIEIINIIVSQNENFLGILSGKILPK